MPDTPAAEPFQAPECAGVTPNDPTVSGDVFPDLTEVFGQRLADYNAGKMVILYDSEGNNNIFVPACGTRYVPGVGAASEWMYCTDLFFHQCSVTDAEGRLTQEGTVVSGLLDRETNPKLSADQERLVHYVLTNTLSLVENEQPTVSSDATYATRLVKQRAIWCISEEPAEYPPFLRKFCTDNFSDAQQQSLLESLPAHPVLAPALSASTTEATVNVGEVVEVALTTNLYETPISVSAAGAEITVCRSSAGLASITGDQIKLNASGAESTTVNLCLSWPSAGTHSIDFSVTPARGTTQALSWVQSPSLVDGEPCQVYSGFDTVAGRTLTARLAVNTIEPAGPEEPGEPEEPSGPTAPAVPGDQTDSRGPSHPAPDDAGSGQELSSLATTGGDQMPFVGPLAALLAGAGIALWATKRVRATAAVSARSPRVNGNHD